MPPMGALLLFQYTVLLGLPPDLDPDDRWRIISRTGHHGKGSHAAEAQDLKVSATSPFGNMC